LEEFPPTQFGGISSNLVYKSDMCPLTCEIRREEEEEEKIRRKREENI
jgi:hypothetical protein